MTMLRRVVCLAGVTVILAAAAESRAAVLVADFNDLSTGSINAKAGGTGWTGNWDGSAGGSVVAGDLTSSRYNVPQSGTAQHYRSINATGLRQNYRTPTSPGPTGTVWFSLLAMAESTGDRAGLSINPPTDNPFNNPGTAHAYLDGDTLRYSFGTGTGGFVSAANAVGSTALLVGRVTITAGPDPVTLWLNPDLVANPDINAYTPVYSSASVDWLTSIGTVGAIAARLDGASTGGGNVDNIRFSDGGGNAAQAYADVTGVPEPAGLALLGAATAGLASRRRRRPAR